MKSSATRIEDAVGGSKSFAAIVALGVGVSGAVVIAYLHHWRFDFSVFMLVAAWVAVLGTAWLLWHTAAAATSDETDELPIREPSHARKSELLREKRAILKAIKETEFDVALGKISPTDAQDIVSGYRARAIELIKELEDGGDQPENVVERIERDVRAVLATTPARRVAMAPQGKRRKKEVSIPTPGDVTTATRQARLAFADDMIAEAEESETSVDKEVESD